MLNFGVDKLDDILCMGTPAKNMKGLRYTGGSLDLLGFFITVVGMVTFVISVINDMVKICIENNYIPSGM